MKEGGGGLKPARPMQKKQNWKNSYLRLVQGKKKGPFVPIALFFLLLASYVYGLLILLRNALYRARILPRLGLEVPVISVGNITIGGTGKTPLVRLVADMIKKKGKEPAILIRGYKGSFQGDVGVVSDGHSILMEPEAAGEEALMLATQLPGVPVIIGTSRYKTGLYAVNELGVDAIILDDGFQHRHLKRNLDIVAIDATNPFGYGYLFPRGLLREPRMSLRRGDIIVLTKADYLPLRRREKLLKRLDRLVGKNGQVIQARHRPVWLRDFTGEKERGLGLNKKKVIAFSGIGDPASFERTLEEMGAELVLRLRFPDHHRYTQEELLEIFSMAFMRGAEMIITTEKDIVGLPENLKELIAGQEMGLWVLGIEIEISTAREILEEKVNQIFPEERSIDE